MENDASDAARTITDDEIVTMVSGLAVSVSALAIAVSSVGPTFPDDRREELLEQLRKVNQGLVATQKGLSRVTGGSHG